MFDKLSHIGIAVFSLEEALKFYRDKLGLTVAKIETVESEGVRVAMLPIGESRIELLEPLNEKSPLHKFLEKRGEGIHHVAFQTPNLKKEVSEKGLSILGDIRAGADDMLISFIHPKQAHGALLELCQKANP